jgi:serine protease Do
MENSHKPVRFLHCFIGTALTITIVSAGFYVYTTMQGKMRILEDRLIEYQNRAGVLQAPQSTQDQPVACCSPVTSSQLWRPVQDMVEDTVVQVFSHISAIDLLKPYTQPAQGSGAGSGFFISEDGYLITNAHVVDQAHSIWIQIPSLGKEILDVELIGVSPERDVALLKVTPESYEKIIAVLGSIPFLTLGDSNTVYRSDQVMALGYPLGQQNLKSTTGDVSGREYVARDQQYIQISAAINPGSSGGPLVNIRGEVVGINSAGIREAQNVGYAIPINNLKIILPDLFKVKLLRKPFLGIVPYSATEALVEYLGNPPPGGCYIVEVIPESNMDRAGIKRGDMLYEINGMAIDRFGDMRVPWCEDKISLFELVNYLTIGDVVNIVFYRNGKRMETSIQFDYSSAGAIKRLYPGLEDIEYEIFGGMVVMELTRNHIAILKDIATGLLKYNEFRNQQDPVLVITHVFGNSQAHRSRLLVPGTTINEIQGIRVKTLDDFRNAVRLASNSKFFTMLVSDNMSRSSDNIFVVLPMASLLDEEPKLARLFRYGVTPFTQEILAQRSGGELIDLSQEIKLHVT